MLNAGILPTRFRASMQRSIARTSTPSGQPARGLQFSFVHPRNLPATIPFKPW
jgi:hypothetical protein